MSLNKNKNTATGIWDTPEAYKLMTAIRSAVRKRRQTVEGRLLPCPFCGGVPKLDETRKPNWKFVVCTSCRAEVSEVTRFKSQVAHMWNRRHNTNTPNEKSK